MKISGSKSQEGSTLLMAMIICLVIGLTLAGYLILTENRFQMTVRSQDWNQAIPVLEAGIEDALTHLKDDAGAPSANNWTPGNPRRTTSLYQATLVAGRELL